MSHLDHRTARAVVTVLGPDGAPLADTDVTVAQTRHAFGFGCTGFEFLRREPQASSPLEDLWLDLFDTATLPFYWRHFEPERGHPRTAVLREAASRLVERGSASRVTRSCGTRSRRAGCSTCRSTRSSVCSASASRGT